MQIIKWNELFLRTYLPLFCIVLSTTLPFSVEEASREMKKNYSIH